jgi:hypothetical protein
LAVTEKERIEQILVHLEDGFPTYVEVRQTGHEDVRFEAKTFQPISSSIETIVWAVAKPIRHISPTQASIKFGLGENVDQGSGKANLENSLEWFKESREE